MGARWQVKSKFPQICSIPGQRGPKRRRLPSGAPSQFELRKRRVRPDLGPFGGPSNIALRSPRSANQFRIRVFGANQARFIPKGAPRPPGAITSRPGAKLVRLPLPAVGQKSALYQVTSNQVYLPSWSFKRPDFQDGSLWGIWRRAGRRINSTATKQTHSPTIGDGEGERD